MHRKQLNERSPLRLLEQSIHGGLGRGNLGVIAARRGTGKTAFLVGVALDDLMQGRKVMHVSLEHSVDRVCTYYDEIFHELAQSQELEDLWRVRREIESNRRIHSYKSQAFSTDRLAAALDLMREHGDFVPAVIMIDGLEFERVTATDLAAVRRLARASDAEVWMSAVVSREAQSNARGVPEPLAQLEQAIDVILRMRHDGTALHVSLLKDHDNPQVSELRLALDPTTMLLKRE